MYAVYLEDVVTFKPDREEGHLEKIAQVFQKLKETKPEKCILLVERVKYVEPIMTQEGVLIDPEKIRAITICPISRNIKVTSVAGVLNSYRKFIPNVTEILASLVNLTKKDVKFQVPKEVVKIYRQTEAEFNY